MPAGRKPKPTALHQLHGNPSKIKNLTRREPPASGKLNRAPKWLSKEQRKEWAYALAHAPRGVLKQIDQSVLLAWVVAADLHRQAVVAQQGNQLLIAAPKTGYPIQSPYLAIINRQALMMKALASELGFTPAARPRLGAPQPGTGASLPAGTGSGPQAPLRTVDDYIANDPTPSASVH